MEVFKAIFYTIIILAMLIAGSILGVVLVPFVIIGLIYFVVKVVTYEDDDEA